jgi:hypothetical protein
LKTSTNTALLVVIALLVLYVVTGLGILRYRTNLVLEETGYNVFDFTPMGWFYSPVIVSYWWIMA